MPEPPQQPGAAKRLFAAATLRATGGDVYVFADELARSSMSDEEAVSQLRQRFGKRRSALKRAMAIEAHNRSNYIDDRTFRLLRAVSLDQPVVGLDPGVADVFARERELGQMPLRDAMARLTELEPRLAPLLNTEGPPLAPDRNNREALKASHQWAHEEMRGLVGSRADHEDPLVRSDLAAGLVQTYLMTAKHNPDRLELPYFTGRGTSIRVSSGSISFGPGAEQRSRPQASN